jgi:hypothetical protein
MNYATHSTNSYERFEAMALLGRGVKDKKGDQLIGLVVQGRISSISDKPTRVLGGITEAAVARAAAARERNKEKHKKSTSTVEIIGLVIIGIIIFFAFPPMLVPYIAGIVISQMIRNWK